MEEMVERLQFENQRAADIFHDQVTFRIYWRTFGRLACTSPFRFFVRPT
jgi:hypothetical protein